MASRTLRPVAAVALALVAVPALAPAAQAADRWSYRSTDEGASTEWIEYGALNGIEGNVHVGFLDVGATSDGAKVFGKVIDYACDPGETPGGGGHGGHGTLEEEPTCDVMSERYIKGGTVTFVMDRKLQTARLTGNLEVDNHGATARPPVDITWTGTSDLASTTSYEKGTEGGTSYVYRYDRTSRDAAVTGAIGPMGFTDDTDDVSTGLIYRSKSYKRSTSR